ncbi:hypothetical protein DPMN_016851 [Dreissena polymorpha]|uniref:Uncharacterized protein n=1 Tax=Dreissena polymorpha TaxID=45954 RepID=A0A9D4S4X6_DREPO|nr:hypothetical protein DPMN_016851 [Dreissena polymorpha]
MNVRLSLPMPRVPTTTREAPTSAATLTIPSPEDSAWMLCTLPSICNVGFIQSDRYDYPLSLWEHFLFREHTFCY